MNICVCVWTRTLLCTCVIISGKNRIKIQRGVALVFLWLPVPLYDRVLCPVTMEKSNKWILNQIAWRKRNISINELLNILLGENVLLLSTWKTFVFISKLFHYSALYLQPLIKYSHSMYKAAWNTFYLVALCIFCLLSLVT